MHVAAWLLVVFTGLIFSSSQREEKSVVVLIPDADGVVGQVAVTTKGGQQHLSTANQMTVVGNPAEPPSAAKIASTEYIDENFKDALSLHPMKPVKFLLYFQPDSTELDPASSPGIVQVLAAIILRESKDIGIHGHSDRTGTPERNLELSLRRAIAVENILLQNGINQDYLEVTSHGEGNPLVPTADGVDEPRNRRGEVVVR
jgi:outer membrane protein OmpA-like peptidoglycan-associated protein